MTRAVAVPFFDRCNRVHNERSDSDNQPSDLA